MLIFLTLAVLFIIGVILKILCNADIIYNDAVDTVSFILTIFGGVTLIFLTIIVGSIQVKFDVEYQNKLYERDMLEYRIEHMEENITGNEMLYNDIVEFNNSLRATKKWANNPWTNWFNNHKIATIDYIELE